MKSRALVAMLFTAFAFSFAASNAQAQVGPDPEDVLERCIAKVRQSVNRCTDANADETRECLRKIRILLAAGNHERARHVAGDCIDSIQRRTRVCVAFIREHCRECIEVLLRLDAPRMARRLAEACENAVDQVQQNGRRSVRAIKAAF